MLKPTPRTEPAPWGTATPGHQPRRVPGAPAVELARSPAAATIGGLAARSGLRLSHFEHRHHLAVPEAWVPGDRADLVARPSWVGGRLVEPKYAAFAYDAPVGSFHPGHHPKWTAHELCHGLVGFAWRPDATAHFHVQAARLNEVLPVALYYFLDEAGLRRCTRHTDVGGVFDGVCLACDRAAAQGPRLDDVRAEDWLRRGRDFVRDELAAVGRARRTGLLAGHRWAHLDLESDALAYVATHGPRMASHTFGRYVELFLSPGLGLVAHLEDLEARVWSLLDTLCGGQAAEPLTAGADAVVAADVGMRLLTVAADLEGDDVAVALDALAERLAGAPGDLAGVVAAYRDLAAEWHLPAAEAVFANGYDLPGVSSDSEGGPSKLGREHLDLAAGIAEVLPQTEAILGDAFEGLVERFVAEEVPVRAPAARRFAAWLAATDPGVVADLARYESAVAHPLPPDPCAEVFAGQAAADGRLRRAEGLDVLQLGVDIDGLMAALDAPTEAEVDVAERPVSLVVRRRAGGDVLVAEVGEVAAAALAHLGDDGAEPAEALGLTLAEATSLVDLGVLVPARFALIGG